MKQGTANNTTAQQKREPIVKKVDVCAVSQIGQPTSHRSLYDGKGVMAPQHKTVIHPKGSQR